MIVAFLVAIGLYITDAMVTRGYQRMEQINGHYFLASQAASDLEVGSDILTEAVRSFVVTEEFEYL